MKWNVYNRRKEKVQQQNGIANLLVIPCVADGQNPFRKVCQTDTASNNVEVDFKAE